MYMLPHYSPCLDVSSHDYKRNIPIGFADDSVVAITTELTIDFVITGVVTVGTGVKLLDAAVVGLLMISEVVDIFLNTTETEKIINY